MIKAFAFVILMLGAMPLPLQAQGAGPVQKSTQAHPTSGTLHGTVRGTGRGTGPAGTPAPRKRDDRGLDAAGSAADKARANEQRMNSAAATSGAISGRNALAPAQAAVGPAGTPLAGSTR